MGHMAVDALEAKHSHSLCCEVARVMSRQSAIGCRICHRRRGTRNTPRTCENSLTLGFVVVYLWVSLEGAKRKKTPSLCLTRASFVLDLKVAPYEWEVVETAAFAL